MKPLVVGLALSPTWLRGDAWRRVDSRVEEMFSLGFYRDVAVAADEAGLDFLFGPDAASLDRSVLDHAPGFSTLDLHTLMSALAPVTASIGLVPTVHTLFDAPYAVARRIQSLRQLSGNRVGWNAVTALGGAANFAPADNATKYERAAEFITVVEGLLQSYPGEALRFDRAGARYADADLVAPIDHAGTHFSVAGPPGYARACGGTAARLSGRRVACRSGAGGRARIGGLRHGDIG